MHLFSFVNAGCSGATSQLFYVMRGNGRSVVGDLIIPWNTGDMFVLPAHSDATHYADTDSAFYYVHDEPLLRYLGANANVPRFEPTLFTAEESYAHLQKAIDSDTKERNRLSMLFGNAVFTHIRYSVCSSDNEYYWLENRDC